MAARITTIRAVFLHQGLAQAAGQVLNILPGDATGAASTCGLPLNSLGPKLLFTYVQFEVTDVASDHFEVLVL